MNRVRHKPFSRWFQILYLLLLSKDIETRELTTKTTLLRGRVLVSVNNLSLKRVLEPVLQASWSTGTDEIIVKKVNMDIQFDK